MNNIKIKQREVIDDTNKMFRKLYSDVVVYTTIEWKRKYFKEIHKYIVDRLKQQTKLWKRKSMDDDIKLIELSRLRLEISNKINSVNKDINIKCLKTG